MSDHKMVPVVATEEMVKAIFDMQVACDHCFEDTYISDDECRDLYAAMLAKAPPFVVTDDFVIRMCNAYDKARGNAALSDPAEFPAMYAAIEAVLGGGA